MGSIGSTIHSINSSLLNEIGAFQSSQTQGATGATPASAASAPDSIDFSQTAKLFQQLQQLQTSNPTEFKQVLTDAAAQFNAAAAQQTNPNAASFLSHLATQFQDAADTGSLSSIQPGSGGAQGAHFGHHHHHAEPPSSTTDPASGSSTSSSSTSLPDLLSSLLSSSGPSTQTASQIQQSLLGLIS